MSSSDAALVSDRNQRSRPSVDAQRMHWTLLMLWGACIFLLSSPFTFTLTGHDPTVAVVLNLSTMREDQNSQWLIYAVRFGVLGIALVFALPHRMSAVRNARQLLPLVPFMAWAALTMLWTDDASTTMHSVIALVTLVLAAYLIVMILPPRTLVTAILVAAAMMAAASFCFALILPAYGIHQADDASQFVHAGAWRGVYMHKNFLGQVAGLFAAVVFWSCFDWSRRKWLTWGLFAALLLLIGLSTSATGLMIVPITLALVWAALKAPPKTQVKALTLAVPVLIAGYFAVGLVLNAVGRDATFSGRTIVWQVAADSLLRHPIAGLGYVSITYGDFSYQLMRRTGLFDPHNAIFDLALGTGVMGVVLFVVAVAYAWLAARRLYALGGGERQAAVALFTLMIAWLIGGITEASDRPFSAMGGLGLFATTALLSMQRMRKPAVRKEDTTSALMRAAAAASRSGT